MTLKLYQHNGKLLQADHRLINNIANGCGGELRIVYTWPAPQRDLDTCTIFLDGKVGYASGPANAYMAYSGDNTGHGPETAAIRVSDAQKDGLWTGTVDIHCWVGWFTTAGGSGGCTVTAHYLGRTLEKSIPNAGTQTGSAEGTTLAATITITQLGGFTLL